MSAMRASRALPLIVAAFALPAPAFAGTAGSGFTGPAFQAANLEANNLSVRGLASGKFQFYDASAGILATAGCTSAFGGWGADCSQTDPGEVLVFLADRDDNFLSYLDGSVAAHVDGGAGNDHLVGGWADDRLSGGPANDITEGGPGNDVVDDTFTTFGSTDVGSGDDTQQGAHGNDTIVGGPGADTIDGGQQSYPGFGDTLDYSSYTAPVTVTVNAGSHDDGRQGEADTVTNIERVLGGAGSDTVASSPTNSELAGAAGDDMLSGGPGNDLLLGDDEAGGPGSGNDVLDGGAGADTLRGGDRIDTAVYASRAQPLTVTLDDAAGDGQSGEGDNVRSDVENVVGGAGDDALSGSETANAIAGGAGADHLTGAGGADALDGGPGDDLVDVRDGGADTIACGAGNDTVNADAQDAVGSDCERVNRPAVAPAVGGGGSGGTAAQSVLLAGRSLKLRARRRVRATLGCPVQASQCAGRLALRPRKATGRAFASTAFRVPAGEIRTVALTLSRPAAKRVRRARRVPATLVATGGPAPVAVPVTVTR